MQYLYLMSKVVFWGIVTCVSAVVLTALIVSAYWRLQGGAVMAVQTSSMVPTFSPGDALVVRPIAPPDIKTGDIISYQSQYKTGVVISHRVVAADTKARTITTRGDHLNEPDTPVSVNAIRGRATILIPKFGYVLTALHKPLGLVILIYLPAMSVNAYELQRLHKRSYHHYVLSRW